MDNRDQVGRRDFIKTTAATAAAVALAASGSPTMAQSPAKRPNIIFYFSDEHRWCSLPFTEAPHVIAPNMTALAQQGTRFDNCCATSPVCVPYRGMLLTGMWPHQSSCISNDTFINHKIVGQDAPTIAHTFRDGGYTTGYIGKWHLGEENVFHTGFDVFRHWVYGDEHWNTQIRDVPERDYKLYKNYNAIGMTDQAIEFIGQHGKGDKPFMLMVSINPPHWRWDDAPKEDVEKYPQDKLPFRPNVTQERYKTGQDLLHYQHYHGHITAVDRELGRLMAALKEQGLEENTILIYTSDHGSSFGSNGVGSKANPYDESARVPLIVRWPGKVPAGRVADHNVGGIDLYPTLCGLAGITPPKHCGGQDFSGVILGGKGPDPKSQFVLINNFQRNYFRTQLDPDQPNIFYPFRAVRTKQHSFAVRADGEWFLYDNQQDPYQLKNLVDDPAHAQVKAELQKELTGWLARAEDPFIPEAWRKLPLPERISIQNRYYSLLPYQAEFAKYREKAVEPHLAKASDAQKSQLRAAAEKVYDEAFMGRYKALEGEITGKRRNSKRPLEQIREQLAAHEQDGARRFAEAVKAIVG